MGTYAVSGSAGAIGGAIRAAIEHAGHEVIGVDIRDAEVVADLSTVEGRAQAVTDVRHAADGALDGLVVAAGLPGTLTPASLTAQVNYYGSVDLLDGLLDTIADGGAAVAVVSNSAGIVPVGDDRLIATLLDGEVDNAVAEADDLHGAEVYARSKAALGRAVRRRAPQWAERGIRLNGVAPGPVHSALLQASLDDPELGQATRDFPIPLGETGQPESIARLVAYLLFEDDFMVGSIVWIDGGGDALIRPDHI